MSGEAVTALQHAARRVDACHWCGASTGRPGVTIRKVRPTPLPAPYADGLWRLCPPCADECTRFGHQLTFAEWRQFYWRLWRQTVRYHLRGLAGTGSPRRVFREVRDQWRFRVKGVKVRA